MNQDAAKTALVTGASRGIGQAVALELGRRGYSVVGTATSGAGVDAIRASFQEHGLHARAYVVDIAERAGVEALMADLAQAGSLPAVLVNNAGATFDNLLLRMTEDEWQRCIDVNLGRRLPPEQGLSACHDEGALRPDHQRDFGGGGDRQPRPVQLRRRQGRYDRLHQGARP